MPSLNPYARQFLCVVLNAEARMLSFSLIHMNVDVWE